MSSIADDPLVNYIRAALDPMGGSSAVRDIPDRNSTGTASQKLRSRATLAAPAGGGGVTWDLHVVTSPLPNFSFFYAKRPSGGQWSPYTGVPRSTYTAQAYDGKFADDTFAKSVARYRAAGQGYLLQYTGPTLADQGRVVAAQLPTHAGKLYTPTFGLYPGNDPDDAQGAYRVIDPDTGVQSRVAPVRLDGANGSTGAAGTGNGSAYDNAGWSGVVGRWFDLPPGIEEQILQSTPSAVQAPARGVLEVRSDFDTGRNNWELSTERLQLGVSRWYPDSAEVDPVSGKPYFAPICRQPDGSWQAAVPTLGMADSVSNTAATSAPFDLKTSTILYLGLDQAASITIEENLFLVVDPQAQGPLAPNRVSPIPCSTQVLDLVASKQAMTPSIVHHAGGNSTQATALAGRGLIGDILGGIGSIASTILPGPWGAIAGAAGGLAQQVGSHINLIPSR